MLVCWGLLITSVSGHLSISSPPFHVLPRHARPPPAVQAGVEPSYQRGKLQAIHPGHLDRLPRDLSPKLALYVEVRDGLIICPPCTHRHKCTPLRPPLVSFRWAPTNLGLRQIIPFSSWIGFTCYFTYRSQRLKGISFSCALNTMRTERNTVVYFGTQRAPFPFFATPTRDVLPSQWRRSIQTQISVSTCPLQDWDH